MMKVILSLLGSSILCNLFLYHFYDSTSSELHIARQDVSRLEATQTSLQKQLENAYSLREIEAKTSEEWKGEQGSLESKKDVLLSKIPTQSCVQKEESVSGISISKESNYVSLDDRISPELISVLSEASSDLQR